MARRFALVAIVALGILGFVVPQAAQADSGPAITVTPSTAVVDGQTVSATAFGFLATDIPQVNDRIVPFAYQCPAGRYAASMEVPFNAQVGTAFERDVQQHCGSLGEFPLSQPDTPGMTTGSFTVRRSVTTSSGDTVQCGLAGGDCVILVLGVTTSFGIGSATAPITFGPPTPETKDDCKKDGWRHFADDQGHPFTNQGRCVSFVESHPK